jgi:2-iminobutanoate/2-iminopropanoate deaminase
VRDRSAAFAARERMCGFAAIGPYSQGVIANGMVFVSGCIGLVRAADGSATMPETVVEQAEQCLKNMAAILEAAGSSMSKVVKTTVLLRDMATYADVNKVYAKAFEEAGTKVMPARAAFAVVGLPANALVEIEAVALA